ncbi:MAG: hypothetical protein IKN72_01120 [Clostridia bacterium]|nr:hypothetical protein [Clostridia bacterium]
MFETLQVEPRCAAALTAAVQHQTLPHAVLLEGADEATRRLAATELAKALLCEGEPKPCGVCRRCKKVDSGNHPDLYFIKKEDGPAIKVDAIRTLKAQAGLLPNDGDRSVFVILEAQNMNVQAQNALLKILEEPAGHVSILLTCPSRTALLETVRSRAAAYALANTAAEAQDPAAAEQARAAAKAFLIALCTGNELDLLLSTAPFQADKALFQNTLSLLPAYFRDALMGKANVTPMSDPAVAARLAATFPQAKLLAFRDEALRLFDAMQRFANHNLSINALCSAFYAIKLQ